MNFIPVSFTFTYNKKEGEKTYHDLPHTNTFNIHYNENITKIMAICRFYIFSVFERLFRIFDESTIYWKRICVKTHKLNHHMRPMNAHFVIATAKNALQNQYQTF